MPLPVQRASYHGPLLGFRRLADRQRPFRRHVPRRRRLRQRLVVSGAGARRQRQGPPHRRRKGHGGAALSHRSALEWPAWGRGLRDLFRRHSQQARHRLGADHVRVHPRGPCWKDRNPRRRRNEDRAYQEPSDGRDAPRRIDRGNGFEYKLAEVGNTVACSVSSAGVSFELANTYAQLNRFEWKSAA